MAFVKLDTQLLNSTIWLDPIACKVFLTALLMAEPYEVRAETQSVQVNSTAPDPFVVPAGWYGFVPAAGPGIVARALVDADDGMAALVRLASPDPGSRTTAHDGRRMVRIDGGYVILNYMRHRDRDHNSAERQARFRARQKEKMSASNARNGVTITPVTHASADADVEQDQKQEQEQEPREKSTRAAPLARPADVSEQVWADWRALRKLKRAAVTQTVLKSARAEASKAGMSLEGFLAEWCVRGSQGLKAEWIINSNRGQQNANSTAGRNLSVVERCEAAIAARVQRESSAGGEDQRIVAG